MSARTILTTASGRQIDLLAPRASDIDFNDVAEHLAKENRFNGGTRDVTYSVAEHLCRGGDAVLKATGDTVSAAYFLLHDVHEYALKDDITPKKRALEAIAVERFGALAGTILNTFAELTDRWDTAAHGAAGLAWPRPPAIDALVKHYDRVMLATEWRDLIQAPPPYDLGAAVLSRPIGDTWDWRYAKAELIDRFLAWLPVYRDGGSRAMGSGQ